MKTFLKLTALTTFLLMLAGTITSCDREPESKPQPEFYFTAFINGRPFVNTLMTRDGYTTPRVFAILEPRDFFGVGSLLIYARGVAPISVYPNVNPQSISFRTINPNVGKHNTVHLRLVGDYIFDNEKSWVLITEFDTVNKIVGGRFQIIGQVYLAKVKDNQDEVLTDIIIKGGRFRSQLIIR